MGYFSVHPIEKYLFNHICLVNASEKIAALGRNTKQICITRGWGNAATGSGNITAGLIKQFKHVARQVSKFKQNNNLLVQTIGEKKDFCTLCPGRYIWIEYLLYLCNLWIIDFLRFPIRPESVWNEMKNQCKNSCFVIIWATDSKVLLPGLASIFSPIILAVPFQKCITPLVTSINASNPQRKFEERKNEMKKKD